MKKTIFIICASLLIACALVLTFFEANEPQPVKTFNEYVVDDYYSVADTISDTTSFFFYEVETVLNAAVDTTENKDIRIVEYTMIVQTEKNVHFIHRNLDSNTRYVETVYGDTWGGCFAIPSPELVISFEQALDSLKASDLGVPHTRYMTMRRPLGVRYEHPIYIFGNSMNAGRCVDTETGDVRIFE